MATLQAAGMDGASDDDDEDADLMAGLMNRLGGSPEAAGDEQAAGEELESDGDEEEESEEEEEEYDPFSSEPAAA